MNKRMLISLILIFVMTLCGCGDKEDSATEAVVNKGENQIFVCYPEGDKVVMSDEGYQIKQPDSIAPSIEETMSVSLDFYENKIENYSYMIDEDNNVDLNITMTGDCSREYCLLAMVAVSDTLFQIDMVESLQITLLAENGEAIDSKYIHRNTFYHYDSDKKAESKRLTFYKASSDGQGLEALSGSLEMEDNVSLVENIVLELERIEAIPEGTKVNSISIISGVCYLDLSEEFQGNVNKVKSDQVVYSLVNSVTSTSNISKVMITIEGQVIESYRGTVDLSKPLSFNKEIIK